MSESAMELNALFSEGLRHHAEGRLDTAMNIYGEVLRRSPQHADALHHLGLIHLQSGRFSQAIEEIRSSLMLEPRSPSALSNLGYCLNLIGDHRRAGAACKAALELDPDDDGAWTNLGNAQRGLDFVAEAMYSYERALALYPSNPHYIYNVGLALFDQREFDRAKDHFQRCLAIDPSIPEAHSNLCACLLRLNDPFVGLEHAERSIELKPDYAEAWCNRGNALRDLRRYEESLGSYERSIELKPDYAEAWFNRGNALGDLKRHEESLASYERSIELKPNYADAYWNKSLSLLRLGNFDHGWQLYEWRWRGDKSPSPSRNFPQPLWLGDAYLEDRTILLHSEQGFGDSIQFCRYAKLVKKLGARVVLEIESPLIELFTTLEGVDEIVEKGAMLPHFDYHCPLLSLPLAFKTTVTKIPCDVPYLYSGEEKREQWAQHLSISRDKPSIGIVWSGNPKHKNDHNRSIRLADMCKIFSDKFHWVSIQKDIPKAEHLLLRSAGVRDHSERLRDFSDTAGLISNLDLVISVDTSVAHLAGALGKPVWVLLPYVPDFRWMWDREDSAWYPHMQLFRQSAEGDWDTVIARVSQELFRTFDV